METEAIYGLQLLFQKEENPLMEAILAYIGKVIQNSIGNGNWNKMQQEKMVPDLPKGFYQSHQLKAKETETRSSGLQWA